MTTLSKKCLSITGSPTLAIDAKAKQMKAEGKDVIGFGAGEPDFNTPAHIVEAAKIALDKGMTKYTPAAGTIELRRAICDKLLKDNGLSYEPAQIIVSNGAKHSLFNAIQAIVNPGDEVLLPAPYWVTYPELVKMADGVTVVIETTQANGFKASVKDIEAAITPRTKALILNSPSNPTGVVYTPAELKAIAELAVEKDIFVISDEIYEELVYDGAEQVSIASFGPEIKKRTILVNGLSKAFSMTGWRIGYTASELPIAKAMDNFQSHATSNPNSIAQYASITALTGSKEAMHEMAATFAGRRDYMAGRINGIDGLYCRKPEGAFYVFVDISKVLGKKCGDTLLNNSMDFAAALLDKELVAVVPGLPFGVDGFIRLSYATSMNTIEKGLDRIETFIKSLS